MKFKHSRRYDQKKKKFCLKRYLLILYFSSISDNNKIEESLFSTLIYLLFILFFSNMITLLCTHTLEHFSFFPYKIVKVLVYIHFTPLLNSDKKIPVRFHLVQFFALIFNHVLLYNSRILL